MSELSWVDRLREELPAVRGCAYLNTGTAGPLPRIAHRAMSAQLDWELGHGRGDFTSFGPYLEARQRARTLVARLLGADASEIGLTHHTSDGMNIVLWGLRWNPGDRVVTTSLEHDAAAVPLGLIAERFGVDVCFADVGNGARDDVLEAIRGAVAGGVRLVAVSHIAYPTGALLPIAEIAEIAHAAGALLVVDGAQSAGVLPLDVHSLGVDAYTVSGQKWLCGPEGTGALYVRADRLDEVAPTFTSYFSAASHDFRGHLNLHPGTKRFESGMIHRPAVMGLAASLEWILDTVGVERAWARSVELATTARERLGNIEGVRVVTPAPQSSPLLSFCLDGFSPKEQRELVSRFAGRGLVIRSIDHPPHVLRASFGFFNVGADIEALADAVAQALVARAGH